MKKSKKVKFPLFKPKKKPRLSPFLHSEGECLADLKLYNQHLKNVFEARPKIDNAPCGMSITKRFDAYKMVQHCNLMLKIDTENQKFIQKLIKIERSGGFVDHINEYAHKAKDIKWQNEKTRRSNMLRENKIMLKRIQQAKSVYAWRKEWNKNRKNFEHMARFPFTLLNKICLDESLRAQPTISGTLDRLGKRLRCYMDFGVKGGPFLGRILIEIYHDHAPVTANNFFHLCRGDYGLSYKNCPVHRIIKNKYLEAGDITRGTGSGGVSIYGKCFDEEKHTLKHSRPGVLTMVRVGEQQNNSKFAITFMEMPQWDKRNVVFGKVIRGAEVLMKINGYGREIGKPLEQIIIIDCGGITCDCTF